MLLSLIFALYCAPIMADEPYYDEMYYPKPEIIEFEGHLWEPYMLMHSHECPCSEEITDVLLKE